MGARKVEAQVASLRKVLDERDLRYEERFTAAEKAVALALSNQKELMQQSFGAARDAVTKAELAQAAVNERQNEFRGQLADQAATLMPRRETETLVLALRESLEQLQQELRREIVSLRESRSEGVGHAQAGVQHRGDAQWTVTTVVSVVAFLTSVGLAFLVFQK